MRGGGGRLRLLGDDVPIGVKAATSLALILHELATNAAKYGALSGPDGCVIITGERRGERFGLAWQERGGPEIAGPPERRGFGTILAERGAITQLGGSIAHDWARGGADAKAGSAAGAAGVLISCRATPAPPP